MRSVTSEIQYTDFEYKGHPVRVIDTPGFFDTSMSPEEIQRALGQFGDVAREGITALLVVVKKERLTAENAAVCEFVHCVLGDGALHKYGLMVMTHSSDATAALKQALDISLYIPISPYTSLDLPRSPYISPPRSSRRSRRCPRRTTATGCSAWWGGGC